MAFIATAHQRITTMLVALKVVIFFPLMYFLYHQHGAFGVAEALLISNLAVFPLYLGALRAYIGIRVSSILRMLIRPTLAALSMNAAIFWFVDYIGLQELDLTGITALIGAVVLGAATFSVATAILWVSVGTPPGVESKIISVLTSKLRSMGRKIG